MVSQLVSKVGLHCVSIAVLKLFLKMVLHLVSSTVVQCFEKVGTGKCLYGIYRHHKLLTLLDHTDVVILCVAAGVGLEVGAVSVDIVDIVVDIAVDIVVDIVNIVVDIVDDIRSYLRAYMSLLSRATLSPSTRLAMVRSCTSCRIMVDTSCSCMVTS